MILVGSPIQQTPAILKEFLESLARVEYPDDPSFLFFDDNSDPISRTLLHEFVLPGPKRIWSSSTKGMGSYRVSETTHHWTTAAVWKVAEMKNALLAEASTAGFDIFLIDSDVLLRKGALCSLREANKDVVSNIFWTAWQPHTRALPQVWISDLYNLYEHGPGEILDEKERAIRTEAFLAKLRVPGLYPVGGLGACTLIKHEVVQKGASFKPVRNITLWGEDRHFCVRAEALGIELWVDTRLPAMHLYRDSDLASVEEFKARDA